MKHFILIFSLAIILSSCKDDDGLSTGSSSSCQLISEQLKYGDEISEKAYTYDDDGRLITAVLSKYNPPLNFVYDTSGRLIEINQENEPGYLYYSTNVFPDSFVSYEFGKRDYKQVYTSSYGRVTSIYSSYGSNGMLEPEQRILIAYTPSGNIKSIQTSNWDDNASEYGDYFLYDNIIADNTTNPYSKSIALKMLQIASDNYFNIGTNNITSITYSSSDEPNERYTSAQMIEYNIFRYPIRFSSSDDPGTEVIYNYDCK